MNEKKIGRYQIIDEIKQGGMATVYRAYDPSFGREVAIKVLARALVNESQFRARFNREATTVAGLEHAAIVPVYDYGEEDGRLYLVMRHMTGGSLSDRIKQGPIPLEETAEILERLAGGLTLAHQKNVIHRDLKPSNILFDQQGKAYLSDFGIVKMVEESETVLTIAGGVIGTPCYMSPEQAMATTEIDHRSDIYSLGVIFYEMLTGNAPYDAKTPIKLAQMHILEPIPDILAANPDLPPACQAVLERVMAKEPDNRYSTAAEFVQAVQELVEPEEVAAPSGRFRTRQAVIIGLAGILLFFLCSFCLGGAYATYRYLTTDEPSTIFLGETTVEVTDPTPAATSPPTEVAATPEPPTPAPTPVPAVFEGAFTREIGTLDPQLANNTAAFNVVENLFVHLTNYHPADSSPATEAAESWEISEDGLVYTFRLRDDIPWVHYDPAAAETAQVEDEAGNPRFVTAADFVYAVRRICDPRISAAYSSELITLISGCQAVKQTPAEGFSPEAYESILVSAPDEQTLVIELTEPAGYFLSLTALPALSAVPEWLIETEGENWTAAGTIVTNGRYVLSEWDPVEALTIVRNPLMPAALHGAGNIETLHFTIEANETAVYGQWLNDAVDLAPIPFEALEAHRQAYGDETMVISDQITFYLAFRMTKPPFDDVHVRRAFSAAYNRQAYINEFRLGRDWMARHFAPPGIFGAPPVGEIGTVFNPDYARDELAIGGYPNCEDFPPVTIVGYTTEGALEWLEFSRSQWVEILGCAEELFQIEQREFPELLASVETTSPDSAAPHIWTYGWGKVYPDEDGWVGGVTWCESQFNHSKRDCTGIDELIVQAREMSDPAARVELYAQIELLLFGRDGEIPFIPVFHQTQTLAVKRWLEWAAVEFGGQHWYDWQLDMAEKGE